MSQLSVKDVRALAEQRFWRKHVWRMGVTGIAAVVLAVVVVVIASRVVTEEPPQSYELEDGTEVIIESRTLIIGDETVSIKYETVNDVYLLSIVPLLGWLVWLGVLAWKQARFRDKFLQKWVDEKEIPDDLYS